MTDVNPGDRFLGFDDDGDTVTDAIPEPYEQFNRTSFETDRDRILYDRYFRRLNDVTQVARAGESYLYHDRLTHSLKVAQVGRRLSELLGRRRELSDEHDTLPSIVLDPDVVETACLAHDMGHPPFGHLAEKELDRLLIKHTHPEGMDDDFDPDEDDAEAIQNGDYPGGVRYEGNAQTFRIITRLAAHNNIETGLGLTRASLNAVLKYPYGRGEWTNSEDRKEGKFGYYKTEKEAFEFAREGTPDSMSDPSLEAQVMDYSDDVTYAIHDVIDFYKTGRIPLDQLLREGKKLTESETKQEEKSNITTPELDLFEEYIDMEDGIQVSNTSVTKLFERLGESALGYPTLFEPFSGSQQERNHLDGFKSYLIGFYLNVENRKPDEENNVRVVVSGSNNQNVSYEFHVNDELKEEVDILRQLTHYYVIQDSSLMAQQQGQRRIIKELFETLYEEAQSDDMRLTAIPKPYSEWVDGELYGGSFTPPCNGKARAIADFISAMTEKQAIEMYERLTGHSPGSLENQIIQ